MHFRDLDDYWQPFLGNQSAAPTYLAGLDAAPKSSECWESKSVDHMARWPAGTVTEIEHADTCWSRTALPGHFQSPANDRKQHRRGKRTIEFEGQQFMLRIGVGERRPR